METKVIKLRDFKPENVKISQPRVTKHGGKSVYVNYDYEDGKGFKPLRIQMPKMKAPFGISGWDKDRTDKKDTSPTEQSNDTLELSIGEHQELINKLQSLEEMIIKQAVNNSKEYFKKKYDESYIKMQFKSAIKFSENEDGEIDTKYPPRLKTKLYKDDEYTYKIQIFNPTKDLVKVNVYNHSEFFPKGCECVTLLQCAGIWIIGEKFGISWTPAQMIVYKSDTKLNGYSFIEEEEESEELEIPEEAEVEEEVVKEVEEEPEAEIVEEDPLEQIIETKSTSTSKRKKRV